MTKQQDKHKTRHAPSIRITTRFHQSEIDQIKTAMKKKKMDYDTQKSEYIRQKTLTK